MGVLHERCRDFLRRAYRWLYQCVNVRLALFGVDWVMSIVALPVTLWLRQGEWDDVWIALLGGALISAGILLQARSYRSLWRYFSLQDVLYLVGIVVAFEITWAPFLWITLAPISFSFFALHAGVLVGLWGSARIGYRLFYEFLAVTTEQPRQGFLVVGTGPEAELFIREVAKNKASPARVIGIFSTSEDLSKRSIHSAPILGSIAHVHPLLDKLKRKGMLELPTTLIIGDVRFRGKDLYQLMCQARAFGLAVKRLLPRTELQPLEYALAAMPLEDLIGRSHVQTDMTEIAPWIRGKRILITGAGGSIGQEITKQVVAFKPAHVALLDHSEFSLYKTQNVVEECKDPKLSYSIHLLDLRSYERVEHLFQKGQFDVVFHAAAIKHVPIVEASPLEAVEINTLATQHLADMCLAYQTGTFLSISTDKAVYPESILGLTKRAGEIYCQALDHEAMRLGRRSRFVSVRFGNVLESAGSAIPLFRQQIQKGNPVTITDRHVERYFMTLQEAVSLVLHAARLSTLPTCKRASVFILDMGAPVRILELVENMILFSGLRPYEDVPISFIGLRPGEKLSEELWETYEDPQPACHEKIFAIHSPKLSFAHARGFFSAMHEATRGNLPEAALAQLKQLISYAQSSHGRRSKATQANP